MDQLLWYARPSACWTDALPIGNGHLGAMVFGGRRSEELALNCDELWSGTPSFNARKEAVKTFEKAKQLVKRSRLNEAEALLESEFVSGNAQFYLPLGKLSIAFDHPDIADDYRRGLDLSRALSFVQTVNSSRVFIASFPDRVLAGRLRHCGDMKIRFTSPLRGKQQYLGEYLVYDGECPGNDKTYHEKAKERGICFRMGLRVETPNSPEARILLEEDGIRIENAQDVDLFLACETSFNGFDKSPFAEGKEYRKRTLEILDQADDFDRIMQDHLKDYKGLYDRVKLELSMPDPNKTLPTDERLKLEDGSLAELLYHFGRYLVIAGSREGTQATTLQGIWNDSMTPPWGCEYTVNINTEMNYWPVLSSGLTEAYEPLTELTEGLSITGMKTAKQYYGKKGWVSHHNSDIWRYSTPVTGNTQWSYWQGSSGWFCEALFEKYLYTMDQEYLQRIWPILREAAVFYEQMLEAVPSLAGREQLAFVMATSPENDFVYEGSPCSVALHTAMMDAIVKNLFERCVQASKVLELSPKEMELIRRLEEKADRIIPFVVGEDGRILEWDIPRKEQDPNHRHVSHLFGLYPAQMITKEDTPQLFEAAKRSLLVRGDDGTGWSLAWKINLWARLLDGDHAFELIKKQLHFVDTETAGRSAEGRARGGTYRDLFCAHPPFQIDGNYGFSAGINEMLVQSRLTEETAGILAEIRILPALPSVWKEGRAFGLRARGGFETEFCWKEGKLTELKIKRRRGLKEAKVRLLYQDQQQIVFVGNGWKSILFTSL